MGKVTKVKGELYDGEYERAWERGRISGPEPKKLVKKNVDVYIIVADTYSELIGEIDNIGAYNLHWCNVRYNTNGSISSHQLLDASDMGFEGLPRKIKRKWRAALRSGSE